MLPARVELERIRNQVKDDFFHMSRSTYAGPGGDGQSIINSRLARFIADSKALAISVVKAPRSVGSYSA